MTHTTVTERSYEVGQSRLTLRFGDLTKSAADVLVSSDDCNLSMGGGVSGAILRAGGQSILIEAAKRAPASLGDVLVTSAGALSAKHVFHAITIGTEKADSKEVVAKATQRCLDLLDALALRSIAFPAIGAGLAGFSYEDVAVQMADTIVRHVSKSRRPIDVTIYLYDRFRRMEAIDFLHFFEEFAARTRLVTLNATAPLKHERKDARPQDNRVSGALRARKQKLEELAKIDREREQLELRLAQQNPPPGVEASEMYARLEQLQASRIRMLREMTGVDPTAPANAFISYAHRDAPSCATLRKFLVGLERQGLIAAWHDRMITAGMEWKGTIDAYLNAAKVILLLISQDFIASEYCYDVEMQRALERHDAGEALVIPIILRPATLKNTPFSRLQFLPQDGKPITTWPNEDEAFVNVVDGIQRAIEESLILQHGARARSA